MMGAYCQDLAAARAQLFDGHENNDNGGNRDVIAGGPSARSSNEREICPERLRRNGGGGKISDESYDR